ncbi:WD40 repeat-like protein [Suillus decipiens]|nr:WD40 repeat-like protein [Suillus decipiens]
MAQLILDPTPLRLFEDRYNRDGSLKSVHNLRVYSIAVSPDGRRMITGSCNMMVCLWDMKEGILLKRLEGPKPRNAAVNALAVSREGQLMASGNTDGTFIAWDLNIGESLTQAIKAHSSGIPSLDFSPDGSMLATGSLDKSVKLWCTKTWELLGSPITFNKADVVRCIRFSPSSELLAIATNVNIQIYSLGKKADFKGNTAVNTSCCTSLAWMPDGTRLFSAGDHTDPTIREWDTLTWKQVGNPWKGHFKNIQAISLNSNGTLLASASDDNCVRLWRVSDQRTIVVFKHPSEVRCVTFSADDTRILSGDQEKVSEWSVSRDNMLEDRSENVAKDGSKDDPKEQAMHQAQGYFKVLAINSDVRNACIAGDLRTAQEVLNREIDADANNYTSYANRAFVLARDSNWDRALHDAIKSVRIQPSFAGHIAKGISLCGKRQVRAARTSFDLASAFTNGDSKTTRFLYLIKTIVLFNVGEHEEAILRVEELVASPNVDTLACRVVEAYLRVRLGEMAFYKNSHNEAVEHFTAAVNASTFFYKLAIHSIYEEFVMLFGWDLKSLWQSANQWQCRALFRAGRIGAAVESYQSTMDKSDDDTKAHLSAWFADLQ